MTAPAFTHTELALRFATRQAQLAHCRCGARVPAGEERCSACRPPAFVPPKVPGKRTYRPKECADPTCRRVFTPTGPRDVYCGGCR